MPERKDEWLSIHLMVSPVGSTDRDIYGRSGDLVLNEVVSPLVNRFRDEKRISRAFFIRYLVGGPHLRLRLRATPDEHAALFAEVVSACAAPIGEPSHGSVRVEPIRARYEPEYSRYGGELGVEASELLFEASSDLVLSLLPTLVRAHSDPDLRLGHAVLGLILLTGAYLPHERLDDVSGFLSRYGSRRPSRPLKQPAQGAQDLLATSMAGLFRAAADPEQLPEALARAARGFREGGHALQAAWQRAPMVIQGRTTPSARFAMRRLASSYVHMHLNRQGVQPRHEALVAGVAAEVLRAEVVAA